MIESWESPFYSAEHNLEVCAGAVEFERKTVRNMKTQLKAVRERLIQEIGQEAVDAIQFAHLREPT